MSCSCFCLRSSSFLKAQAQARTHGDTTPALRWLIMAARAHHLLLRLVLLCACACAAALGSANAAGRKMVGVYELKAGDFSVSVTNWGATITSVVLPDSKGALAFDFPLIPSLSLSLPKNPSMASVVVLCAVRVRLVVHRESPASLLCASPTSFAGNLADVVLGYDTIGGYVVSS